MLGLVANSLTSPKSRRYKRELFVATSLYVVLVGTFLGWSLPRELQDPKGRARGLNHSLECEIRIRSCEKRPQFGHGSFLSVKRRRHVEISGPRENVKNRSIVRLRSVSRT